jgi:REP-associated tyrosine transposase
LSHLAGTMVAVGYHSTNKAGCSARYHLIWCPKDRRRVLVSGVDERVKVIIGDVAAEVGAEVIEVEVMPDQVHLLAEVPPTVPLSRFVGLAKGRSSRLLRMECPRLAAVAGAVEPVVGCVHGRRSAPGGRRSIRGEPEGGVVR